MEGGRSEHNLITLKKVVCVYVHMRALHRGVPRLKCGSQRTTCGNWFYFSTCGLPLLSSSLESGAFTL